MLIFKEINPQGEIKWGEKANYYFGIWKTDVHVITDSRSMKTASLPQSKGATELPDLKSELRYRLSPWWDQGALEVALKVGLQERDWEKM